MMVHKSAKHMQHTAHMGYGYTQIWGLIGFAHGQIYTGSETHSLLLLFQSVKKDGKR